MNNNIELSRKRLPIKNEPVSDEEPSSLEVPQWHQSLALDDITSEKEGQFVASSGDEQSEMREGDKKTEMEENQRDQTKNNNNSGSASACSQPSCNCNCSQLIKAAVEELKEFLRQEIRLSIHQALSDTALHGSLLGDDSMAFPSPRLLPSVASDQVNITTSDFDQISTSPMQTQPSTHGQPIHAQSSSVPFFYSDQSSAALSSTSGVDSCRSVPSDREVLRMAQEASSRGNFCVLLMRTMFTTEERLRDTNCRGVKKPKFDETGERLEKIIELAKRHFGPGDERLIRAEAYKRIDEANRRLRYQHNFSLYREAVHSTGNPEVAIKQMKNGDSGIE